MFSIYKHTLKDNSFLVGIVSDAEKVSWLESKRYKKNKPFSAAVVNEGWNNITHELLEADIESEKEANSKLAYYLFKALETGARAYNKDKVTYYYCKELDTGANTL